MDRLVDVAYPEVIKTIQERIEIGNEGVVDQLPDARDVQCVLEYENSFEYRYFIYTTAKILYLFTCQEEWDLIEIPKQTPFKSVVESAKRYKETLT